MPYEIKLRDLVVGYAAERPNEEGRVKVVCSKFSSSEDGQDFIGNLESILNPIVSSLVPYLDKPIELGQISSLLAIVTSMTKATVYMNEMPFVLKVQISRACEKGEPLKKDEIVDILDMDLGGIEIPKEAAVVFYFTQGWRRGMYFDFCPILKEPQYERPEPISEYFASLIAHVSYQERFSLNEEEWNKMFSHRWFPFTGLGSDVLRALVQQIKLNEDPDYIQDRITDRIKNMSASWLTSWKRKSLFSKHIKTLETVITHFRNADYLSTSSMLMPRIEGILRTYQQASSSEPRFKPQFLAEAAVSSKIHIPKSLLLPMKFDKYLKDVYFEDFCPLTDFVNASRHSVAHGIAPENELNEKTASIAILIVHQLFYFCTIDADSTNE